MKSTEEHFVLSALTIFMTVHSGISWFKSIKASVEFILIII